MNSVSNILSSRTDDFLNTAANGEKLTPNDKQLTPTGNQTTYNNETLQNSASVNDYHLPISDPGPDLNLIKKQVYQLRDQLDSIIRALDGEQIKEYTRNSEGPTELLPTGEQVIEGVFNGEKMVGPDGKEYSVPPNYASKSKLVEGDMMKLTITNQGRFIFKSIGPIERKRIKGELVSDSATDQWSVLADGKTYKILKASVTFWKGHPGDDVILLVPESGESSWGGVENIIQKN